MFKLLLLVQTLALIYAYSSQHIHRIRVISIKNIHKTIHKLSMFNSNDPTSTPTPVNDVTKKQDISTNGINENKESALPLPTGFNLGSISTILIYGYLIYLFLDTLYIIVTGKSFDFSQYGK